MAKGIIGFRFDAVRSLFESETFLDEPYLPGKPNIHQYDYLDHIYTQDLPEVIDIINKWREFMDNFTKENNFKISR